MINCIKFDPVTREVVRKNNDFVLTTNPSDQNAGIILFSKGAFPLTPMLGIGLVPQVINGPVPVFTFEMNRWQFQMINDGATFARWSNRFLANQIADINIQASYL